MTQAKRYTTSAYRDAVGRWVWLFPGISLLLAIVGLGAPTTLWTGGKYLLPESDLVSPVLDLKPSWFGAFRIKAKANLPYQRWAAIQVSLEDPTGKTTLVEAGRELWAETGIWREGSESGTWAERDVEFELDAALVRRTKARLRVELVELTDTRARPVENEAVHIRATIQARATDGRWLWFGFFASLLLAVITQFAVFAAGQIAIVESNEDSEVEGRGVMGGPKTLTKLAVIAIGDENTKPSMAVRISIEDEKGEDVLDEQFTVQPRFVKDEDGDISQTVISLKLYLELPRRGQYKVWAEIIPDDPIDRIKLLVRDRCRTLGPVEVIKVGEAAA